MGRGKRGEIRAEREKPVSNSDSFIDEVNEEVRRDRLYGYLRRYGWIAVVAILALVGGTAWTEYRKASAQAEAEALGDALLVALVAEDAPARVAALEQVQAGSAGQDAVLKFHVAAQQVEAGNTEAAIATLDALAVNGEISPIMRQVAQFKSLTLQAETTPAADRRIAFEAMAQPGAPLRMLAEEQLALIDIAEGDAEAAIARYQAILVDAEVSQDLQQRALQVIVALGGEPELPDSIAPPAEETPAVDN